MIVHLSRVPRRIGQVAIRAYQKTLSPDHGPFQRLFKHGVCKFHPTCSQYAYEAVGKYGLVRGSWLGARRVLRCHPFTVGGFDPVP